MDRLDTKYEYSEIFYSLQGEGVHTGKLSAWLRFFNCNLQCDGFGQTDPMDKETYVLPYKDIDVSPYEKLEELPVFNKGCDSSYSWSKKFKHLQHRATPKEIAQQIVDSIKTEHNPEGHFRDLKKMGARNIHMCFTGGEPLLKKAQACSIDVMNFFYTSGNFPTNVTYETNGTQPLTETFEEWWGKFLKVEIKQRELFFSVSPKLRRVSGECNKKAIKPDVVGSYYKLSPNGQLKFVLDTNPKSWDEMERHVESYRKAGCYYPVWIMPVSATVEGQYDTALPVTEEAMKRGYNVAARVHTYIFGNAIGT